MASEDPVTIVIKASAPANKYLVIGQWGGSACALGVKFGGFVTGTGTGRNVPGVVAGDFAGAPDFPTMRWSR